MVTQSEITQGIPKKLIIGFITIATTAMFAATAFAGASPSDKPTKEECEAAGFKNYGQCVKEWKHDKNHGDHGYGGHHHKPHKPHKPHKHHEHKDKKDKHDD